MSVSRGTAASTLSELVETCFDHIQNSLSRAQYDPSKTRSEFAKSFVKFHIDAGTYNNFIRDEITKFSNGNSVLLMTAHQPNLFAYSGIYRKVTLLSVLKKELQKKMKRPVVAFFCIADQDLTDDRWVKSTQLPDVTRKDGILNLNIDLPEQTLLFKAPKPSTRTFSSWHDELAKWLKQSSSSLIKINNISQAKWVESKTLLEDNLSAFWGIVSDSYENSRNYSDFNSFLMSKIVNEVWNYDILFSRFSDSQRTLTREFNFLLERYRDYSDALKELKTVFSNKVYDLGVSENEYKYLPFWYHCECSGKVRLEPVQENSHLIASGICTSCEKLHEFDLGDLAKPSVNGISHDISARAIPMILIFSRGLDLSCYIGGIGGTSYLEEAGYVAEKLSVELPIVALWRPRDAYLGVSQLHALLEYFRISGSSDVKNYCETIRALKNKINQVYEKTSEKERMKESLVNKYRRNEIEEKTFRRQLSSLLEEISNIRREYGLSHLLNDLRVMENIPKMVELIPSIIDYAVNIGLQELNDQWVKFLNQDNSLNSEVTLISILDNWSEYKDKYLRLADLCISNR